MTLHQTVQRVLLIGARLEKLPPAPTPQPPQRLKALIDALEPAHRNYDERAIFFGHRYRSGFWAIYLLSALAVLCAIVPLALGWDSRSHALHPFAGVWAFAEVCVIAIVTVIYWRGHRRDWQGEWLRMRTTAELTWYLPLLAPLVDFEHAEAKTDPNWYARVFDPGQHLHAADEVAAICTRNEALARATLQHAWQDTAFVTSYARWTIDILEGQRSYHHGVALKQHTVMHRVHALNSWLFGLTALGALLHLILHTLWLTLVTTFFPALGSSLHGALAQSEAYRLSATSERLVKDLQAMIDRIRAALGGVTAAVPAAVSVPHIASALATATAPIASTAPATISALATASVPATAAATVTAAPVAAVFAVKASIEDALALILEEHQDWQMLVRPHHLPLA